MDYGTQLLAKWMDKTYRITQRPGPASASTRKYYKIHQGYDYATPAGTPIKSKVRGQVVFAGYDKSGFGNRVGIYEPSTGVTTYLSHLSDIGVKPGQKIDVGTYIGATGGIPGSYGAGNTTGAHLDITEYRNNKPYIPRYSVGKQGNYGKIASIGNYMNYLNDYARNVLARARTKYGKKVVAVASSPEKLRRLGIRGKIVRL